MPTVTVENGIGVANANSYVSLSDADVYFGTRLFSDVWTSAVEATKQKALIQAARTLDNYIAWFGVKADSDQTMQWPRRFVYETQLVNSIAEQVELVNVIPTDVVNAQCELSIYLLESDRTALPDTAGFSELNIAGAVSFKVDNNTKPALIPSIVFQLVGKYGSKKGIVPQIIRA